MNHPAEKFELSDWRLIQSDPTSGPRNMAIDEALLQAVKNGDSPPVLRLYSWTPPCLSLGYGQSLDEIDLDRLADAGWGWVRRTTGGKAILHTDEMTYAVIGTNEDPRLSGTILESYLVLSQALANALTRLGLSIRIEPEMKASSSGLGENPVCFEVPSAYEITSGGKKLVGSAQARKRRALLQHGTIPLYGDLGRITDVLHYTNEQARQVAGENIVRRATTVERELGKRVEWEEMAEAIQWAFTETLNIRLVPSDLNAEENSAADKILQEKLPAGL